jgi:hypothetical protein
MAYRGAEAARRGDYRRGEGGDMPEQADATSGSGAVVTELQNRLRSVELAPRPRSSEQVSIHCDLFGVSHVYLDSFEVLWSFPMQKESFASGSLHL